MRPEDQRFLDRAGGGLRFLVFDELHTYRGRQGADVAMLIRRLKERCAAPGLIHVGTSATMVANPSATPQERRAAVADFARRLFGHPLTPDQVIEETLVTFTEGGTPSPTELAAASPSRRRRRWRNSSVIRWRAGRKRNSASNARRKDGSSGASPAPWQRRRSLLPRRRAGMRPRAGNACAKS